ncbi:MAG: hypothetical protein ACYCSJ_13155 [Acidimicrobiales bacterium]
MPSTTVSTATVARSCCNGSAEPALSSLAGDSQGESDVGPRRTFVTGGLDSITDQPFALA